MIASLRGMNDWLGDEAQTFSHILQTATTIAKNYGFSMVQTPILEETALFKRSVGESSDIVGKEMYRFEDKGSNDVCMRPEGTAGVVRAFVQAKLDRQPGIRRFYYHGPMYRYERPQKGRLRQFHQFGCEVFGTDSVYEDATVIRMTADILKALGIGYELKINSLGCASCVPPYRQKLLEFLHSVQADLCEDCHRRIETNPMRTLDCKNPHCQEKLKNAPKITYHLCEKCENDFVLLRELLMQVDIRYVVDENLVRGLDYYTQTAFEFTADTGGSQNAVAGGGRYDKLVEQLDGKPTAAVGFAIGLERLAPMVVMPEKSREGVYLGAMCEEALVKLWGTTLRNTTVTLCDYNIKSLAAHLKAADAKNARFCAVIGSDELEKDEVWIKDLVEKREWRVAWNNFTLEGIS